MQKQGAMVANKSARGGAQSACDGADVRDAPAEAAGRGARAARGAVERPGQREVEGMGGRFWYERPQDAHCE